MAGGQFRAGVAGFKQRLKSLARSRIELRVFQGDRRGRLGDLRIQLARAPDNALSQGRSQSLGIFDSPTKGFPRPGRVTPLDQRLGEAGRDARFDLDFGRVVDDFEPVFDRRFPVAPSQLFGNSGQNEIDNLASPPLFASQFPPSQHQFIVLGVFRRSVGERAPRRLELAFGDRSGGQRQSGVGRRLRRTRTLGKPALQAQHADSGGGQNPHGKSRSVSKNRRIAHAVQPDSAHNDVLGEEPERKQHPTRQSQAPPPTPQPVRDKKRCQEPARSAERNSAGVRQAGVGESGKEKSHEAKECEGSRPPSAFDPNTRNEKKSQRDHKTHHGVVKEPVCKKISSCPIPWVHPEAPGRVRGLARSKGRGGQSVELLLDARPPSRRRGGAPTGFEFLGGQNFFDVSRAQKRTIPLGKGHIGMPMIEFLCRFPGPLGLKTRTRRGHPRYREPGNHQNCQKQSDDR